jgi:RHS repeat-associated protein
MIVRRQLFPVLLYAFAASSLTLFSAATAAQIPGPPVVTPDGGSRTVDEGQSGLTINFEVESQSSFSENFSLSCGRTGEVASCSVQGSITIGAFDMEVVQVTYATDEPGSGTVTLTATGSGGNNGGYWNITVEEAEPEEPPANWDLTPFNNDNQRCADACAGLVLTHSTVPYFTMDTPRNVTLVYNSERAPALPLVQLDVQKPSESGCTPIEIRLAVEEVGSGNLEFVNGETTLRFTPQTTTRIGGRIEDGLSTGIHDIELVVTFYYTGGGCPGSIEQSWQTKLMVVDETSSPIARGWTVAGVQRLYLQSDSSALITQGDGSAVFFQKEGVSWVSPAGEPSTLYKNGGSGFKRLYPDSTDVRFNTAGRMTTVYDPDNNATTFSYDGSNRLSYINDPKSKKIYFKYNANGIDSIYAAVGSPYRATQYTVNGSDVLTVIREPNGTDSTRFTYNGSLELVSMTDVGGGTTDYNYWSTTGELKEIEAPSVPTYPSGSDEPTTAFYPWVRRVAPSASTSSTKWPAPSASAVWDTVTTPGGSKTLTRVNRFGDPVEIDVPLAYDTDVLYNNAGLPVRIERSGGWGTDSIAYDSSDRPIWMRTSSSSASSQDITYGLFSKPDSIWGGGQQALRQWINSSTGRVDSLRRGGNGTYTGKMKFVYNGNGQVTKITNEDGTVVSRRGYDTMGNVKADTAAGDRVTTLARDGYGRITSVTLPDGSVQTTYYDVLNRPDSLDDGYNTKAIRFGASSTVDSVIDPRDLVYATERNALGWPVTRRDPLDEADDYEYDVNGQLRAWQNRRGQTVTYTYDDAFRLLIADADTTSYDSGTNGRKIRAANAYARDSIFLNARGQPEVVKTYFPGLGNTYTINRYYDVDGMLDSTKVSGPSVSFLKRTYTYDADRGALVGIKLSSDQTSMEQAPTFYVDKVTYPGNRVVNTSGTASKRISEHAATAGYSTTTDRQAGYDDNDRLQMQLQLDASTAHRYGYDELGRLVADTIVSASSANCSEDGIIGFFCTSWTYQTHTAFDYDASGNREDGSMEYLSGSNHIRERGGVCDLDTDDDGNVTSEVCTDLWTRTYTWDKRNRLTGVVNEDTTYALRYDAQGRLVRIDSGSASPSPMSYFLWDGDDLLAELDAAGDIVLEYSHFPGMDNLHAVKKGGSATIYYAHRDMQANVIALTNGSSVSRTYEYSPWGRDIGGTDNASFDDTDRSRWKGALAFPEFGDLYYMRTRWYHPSTGRFLSEDPIGLQGGINPYIFAADDPINGRDPTGLCPPGTNFTLVLVELDDGTAVWEAFCMGSGGAQPFSLPDINVSAAAGPWPTGWTDRFGNRSSHTWDYQTDFSWDDLRDLGGSTTVDDPIASGLRLEQQVQEARILWDPCAVAKIQALFGFGESIAGTALFAGGLGFMVFYPSLPTVVGGGVAMIRGLIDVGTGIGHMVAGGSKLATCIQI